MVPEDEWFTERGQVAMDMLNGKATVENAENAEATSPTTLETQENN